MNEPRKTTTSTLGGLVAVFAGGNLIASVLRMANGVFTARLLAPSALGLFNSIGLVVGYAPFLHAGVLTGLTRELPLYMGKGKHEEAACFAAVAQAWALLVGVVSSATLLVAAVYYAQKGRFEHAAGWLTFAVSIFVLLFGNSYLNITYRTYSDFARLSMFRVVQAVTSTALLSAIWALNYYGLCVRAVVVDLVVLAMLWHWRPIKVTPSWDWRRFLHLLKTGAPIFFVAQLFAWWSVLNSTLVASQFGAHQFGFYTLALLVEQAIMILPSALVQITYPRVAELYGRHSELSEPLRYLLRPMLLTLGLTVPIVGVGWIVAEPVAAAILPRYMPGVDAARWSLLFGPLFCFQPLNHTFILTKRQDLYAVAIAAGIAAYAVVLEVLIERGPTLVAFPQAMLSGRLVFTTISIVLVVWLWRHDEKREGCP